MSEWPRRGPVPRNTASAAARARQLPSCAATVNAQLNAVRSEPFMVDRGSTQDKPPNAAARWGKTFTLDQDPIGP